MWHIEAVAHVPGELVVTLRSEDGKNRRVGKLGADLLEKLLYYGPELHDGRPLPAPAASAEALPHLRQRALTPP